MLVKFSFSYGFKPTPEELAAINAAILGNQEGIEIEEDGSAKTWRNYTGDLGKILPITNKIQLQEQETHLTYQLIQKIEAMEAKIGSFTQDRQFNERVSIHIPGAGLLSVRFVKVENDYCTDRLQEDLEAGWRILAICPQPDQRRPDYILGKS